MMWRNTWTERTKTGVSAEVRKDQPGAGLNDRNGLALIGRNGLVIAVTDQERLTVESGTRHRCFREFRHDNANAFPAMTSIEDQLGLGEEWITAGAQFPARFGWGE